MKKKILLTTAQTAALMAILTGLSKVLGFAREMVLAGFFGAGTVTDAYVMAQSIPNSLFAAVISAVGISFMPAFSKKKELEGRDAADLFTSRILNLQFVIIAVVVILGCVFSGSLVRFFAPGFDNETSALTSTYLKAAFCILFFSVLTYILGAWLNYKEIFVPQMAYSIAGNIVLIGVIVISSKTDHRFLIAGPVLAAALSGVCHFIRSKREGFVYSLSFTADSYVKDVLNLAIPIFLGGYVNQINLAIDRVLASGLESGCVSALNYANQIITAVSSLTVAIFVTILYPRLNKAYVQGDFLRMSDLSERGIRLILVLCVPFSLGLCFFSNDVIRILFERGAFDAVATKLTSPALAAYAIGLAFLSVNTLITKIYYSMHDTKTAVKCSAVSVLLNIVLNFILVRFMGHMGLALATSISHAANTALLVYTFTRRYPKITLISRLKPVILIAVFSVISVGIAYIVYGIIGAGLIKLMLCAGAAAAIYLVFLLVFRFEELDLLKQLIKR